MPFFSVLIHGEGIRHTIGESERPVVGFYTTRVVWARSGPQACAKTLASVRALWTTGALKNHNRCPGLSLSVDSYGVVGFRAWLLAPNKGHAFYTEEEHAV